MVLEEPIQNVYIFFLYIDVCRLKLAEIFTRYIWPFSTIITDTKLKAIELQNVQQ